MIAAFLRHFETYNQAAYRPVYFRPRRMPWPQHDLSDYV